MAKVTEQNLGSREVDDLMCKAALWGARAAMAISAVGGDPDVVLGKFSDESIATMARNRLELTVKP